MWTLALPIATELPSRNLWQQVEHTQQFWNSTALLAFPISFSIGFHKISDTGGILGETTFLNEIIPASQIGQNLGSGSSSKCLGCLPMVAAIQLQPRVLNGKMLSGTQVLWHLGVPNKIIRKNHWFETCCFHWSFVGKTLKWHAVQKTYS